MTRADDDVREIVYLRSRGQCEVRGPDCTGRANGLHHRLRAAHGGPMTAANAIAACDFCHTLGARSIHRNPAWAYEVGLLIHSWEGPPTEEWRRPE